MQQITFSSIKNYNKNISKHDSDCLPEGQSYDLDFTDDIPEDEHLSNPFEDADSPLHRFAWNDDNSFSAPILEATHEAHCKTLKGDIVDEDGWLLTDIPEGSQNVAGDVIQRQSTEDPLTWNSEEEHTDELEDESAPLIEIKLVRL